MSAEKPPAPPARPDRDAQLAQALRANLKRRKAKASEPNKRS